MTNPALQVCENYLNGNDLKIRRLSTGLHVVEPPILVKPGDAADYTLKSFPSYKVVLHYMQINKVEGTLFVVARGVQHDNMSEINNTSPQDNSLIKWETSYDAFDSTIKPFYKDQSRQENISELIRCYLVFLQQRVKAKNLEEKNKDLLLHLINLIEEKMAKEMRESTFRQLATLFYSGMHNGNATGVNLLDAQIRGQSTLFSKVYNAFI